MSRLYLLLLCLLSPVVQGSDNDHDLAYSLGVKLGERLREEVPQLDLQALLEGLRQAYRNEPLALSDARMQELLDAHEKELAEPPEDMSKARLAEHRFLAQEKAKAGIRVLENGILIQPLRAGSGKYPKPEGRVLVRYTGWLADGTQFDETKTPQWFTLSSVIAGWQQALPQMQTGARWRLVIPSAQAYGAEGAGDLIPPYAPLVFDLELLDTRG